MDDRDYKTYGHSVRVIRDASTNDYPYSRGINNIALNKIVNVSSVASSNYSENNINDGDYNTYWSSNSNDDEWIYIDLRENTILSQLRIYWETAYAKHYEIQTMFYNNNMPGNWETLHVEGNSDGNVDLIGLNNTIGRWLRINCKERATNNGNAIKEIEVYTVKRDQRLADGSAVDQDGNTFEWINYGDLDWAIEDAKVTSYRDGTPIPLDDFDGLLGPGKRNYYLYDSSKTPFYNWYAVAGIYNEATYLDPSLPEKNLHQKVGVSQQFLMYKH